MAKFNPCGTIDGLPTPGLAPIVASYDQQGILRTYSSQGVPEGIPTPDPHGEDFL